MWDKEMISHLGQDGAGNHEISSWYSERCTIENLWIVYFWNFPFNIFRLHLATGNWNHRRWNCGGEEGLLYKNEELEPRMDAIAEKSLSCVEGTSIYWTSSLQAKLIKRPISRYRLEKRQNTPLLVFRPNKRKHFLKFIYFFMQQVLTSYLFYTY